MNFSSIEWIMTGDNGIDWNSKEFRYMSGRKYNLKDS